LCLKHRIQNGGVFMNQIKPCAGCNNRLCIHKVPIFSLLSKEDLLQISQLIVHKSFEKGEFIFREGDRLDSIIIMNQGSAKAVKYTADGREQILYVLLEGDFFGENNILANQTAQYSIQALKPSKICMLSKENFNSLLKKHPSIAIKIIEELGNRINRLESTIKSMGVRDVDARIANLLIDYLNQFGQKTSEGILIKLPISKEEIANLLGLARETLSRKLRLLEERNIIKSIGNKNILILSETDLKVLAGIN
jgi:CRP-like cAMP-binding protein